MLRHGCSPDSFGSERDLCSVFQHRSIHCPHRGVLLYIKTTEVPVSAELVESHAQINATRRDDRCMLLRSC